MSILNDNLDIDLKSFVNNKLYDYCLKPYSWWNDVLSKCYINRILKRADEYKVFFKYESHSWNLCIAIYPAHSNWSFIRYGFKGGIHTLSEFLSRNFNHSWMLNDVKQAMINI